MSSRWTQLIQAMTQNNKRLLGGLTDRQDRHLAIHVLTKNFRHFHWAAETEVTCVHTSHRTRAQITRLLKATRFTNRPGSACAHLIRLMCTVNPHNSHYRPSERTHSALIKFSKGQASGGRVIYMFGWSGRGCTVLSRSRWFHVYINRNLLTNRCIFGINIF